MISHLGGRSQVLWGLVYAVDIADGTERLGVTLSDHNLVAQLDVLDTVLELEGNSGLVVTLHVLLIVNSNCLNSLSDTSNVQHGLVTDLDVRMVVQYLDLGIEVLHTE